MEKTHFPPKSAMLKDRDFESELRRRVRGIEKFHKNKIK